MSEQEYTPTEAEIVTALVTYRAIAGAKPPSIRTLATPVKAEQFLAEARRGIEQIKAEVRADERAKRPDREQARTAAERMHLPLDRPAMSSELTAVQGFVDGAEWALATSPDGKEEIDD